MSDMLTKSPSVTQEISCHGLNIEQPHTSALPCGWCLATLQGILETVLYVSYMKLPRHICIVEWWVVIALQNAASFLVISWDAVCLMCLSCWTISLVYLVCILLVSQTVISTFGWIDNSKAVLLLFSEILVTPLFMHFFLTQRPIVGCPVSECSSPSATNHYKCH